MAINTPPLLGRELPAFVRDLLGSAPRIGEGVNQWLFRIARLLHPYRHEEEIVALLHAATHGEHIRAGEIERAVKNSKAAAWQPRGCASDNRGVALEWLNQGSVIGYPPKWPPLDEQRRATILAGGIDAAELCECSPVCYDVDDGRSTAEIVELLFSTVAVPDPLLCVGRRNAEFATRPLSTWIDSDKLPGAALIVPSPMRSRLGRTKAGKESEHTLENTGARRFLIVEFDQGATDEHAALLWHLADYGPLALVVHSGGKSLHGWFYCHEQPEGSLRRFMGYAVSLGADSATWTRSQFVRLPAGQRENGVRQHVFYFDPAAIDRTQNS